MSGLPPADVRTACVEKLGVDDADADGVIAAARQRITIAADYDRDAEVGKAVTRLNDIYARAIRGQDMRTALAAQRELNRLLGLYQPAADPTESESPGMHELHQVREHLEPLGLGKPASSTVELVRQAVLEIIRLRSG